MWQGAPLGARWRQAAHPDQVWWATHAVGDGWRLELRTVEGGTIRSMPVGPVPFAEVAQVAAEIDAENPA